MSKWAPGEERQFNRLYGKGELGFVYTWLGIFRNRLSIFQNNIVHTCPFSFQEESFLRVNFPFACKGKVQMVGSVTVFPKYVYM